MAVTTFKYKISLLLIICISIIEITMNSSAENRWFKPVDYSWQNSLCTTFNMDIKSQSYVQNKVKMLKPPSNIKNIHGDGNCFFRAIAYCITGSEEDHLYVRSGVSEKIITEKNKLKQIVGKDYDKYINANQMMDTGNWATEIDVYAAASYLSTSIMVFNTENGTWNLYHHSLNVNARYDPDQLHIYLNYLTNKHYNVVLDVED